MYRFFKERREAFKKYLLIFFLSVVSIGMVISLAPITPTSDMELESNVLAEIHGASIRSTDLQRLMQARLRNYPNANDPQMMSRLATLMLDDMVLRRALQDEAGKLGITVSNTELQRHIESEIAILKHLIEIGRDQHRLLKVTSDHASAAAHSEICGAACLPKRLGHGEVRCEGLTPGAAYLSQDEHSFQRFRRLLGDEDDRPRIQDGLLPKPPLEDELDQVDRVDLTIGLGDAHALLIGVARWASRLEEQVAQGRSPGEGEIPRARDGAEDGRLLAVVLFHQHLDLGLDVEGGERVPQFPVGLFGRQAGHRDLDVAGRDALRREHDRLEAGAAHLVDRQRGDVLAEAALERRLPGRVLAVARLDDVAHDALVDGGGIDPGAGDRFAHRHRAELRRGEVLERAEEFAGGGSDCGEDD